MASTVSSVVKCKLADHYIVGCHFAFPVLSNSRPKIYSLNILDIAKFDKLVATFDWNKFLRNATSCTAHACFVDTIHSLKTAAQKTIAVKKRNHKLPWLSLDILTAIKEKDALWSRCKRAPNNTDLRNMHRSMRNRVNAMIRSARRHYYNKTFYENKHSPRKMWSAINEVFGRNTFKSLEDVFKKHFRNLPSAVQEFNCFFSKTSSYLQPFAGDAASAITSTLSSALLPPVTSGDLHSILFSFRPKKPPGIDGIYMNDLQRNYAVLESVLLFIINGCIEHGVIPDDLKVAVVKPLYKSGSRSEVDNYRPISILPAISQIIEKHLLIIMTNFLNKNNILSEAQFGFIQGRSTITLLEEFTDIIYSAFDNN